MVTTRSAGASEPLEMLHTPPKKTRKTRKPKVPVQSPIALKAVSLNTQEATPSQKTDLNTKPMLVPHLSPWSLLNILAAKDPATTSPYEATHVPQPFLFVQAPTPCPVYDDEENDIFVLAPEQPEEVEDFTTMETDEKILTETSPPAASTSKRQRSEDEFQDNDAQVKRARMGTPHHTRPRNPDEKLDMLFMFPKKQMSDEEDEELTLSAPPKSYAAMIRRERRLRQLRKKNDPLGFGLSPRRPLAKVTGQNPFGFDTFTKEELGVSQRQKLSTTDIPPDERFGREGRSAAPEPETPKPRGLFGSLRNLGSVTIGSIFGTLTPKSGTELQGSLPEPSPQVRTEPRIRKSKPVWEIEYPQLPPTTPGVVEEEETESEQKRKAFEATWGKTNRDYDHLHTESIDGDPNNLPYPIKKKPPPAPPVNEEELDAKTRAFRQERKKMNLMRYGLVPERKLPKTAPLFGPDSHWARKTVDPRHKERKPIVPLQAGSQPLDLERKRKADEIATSSSELATSSDQSRSRTFQPYVEDESEKADAIDDLPSTPAAKRQKTSDQIPQTPRSALKVPGSVGRSGRSVMFNANPVASVKRMTPPSINPSPAGEYNPQSPFRTYADVERDRQADLMENSPASTISLDPSPNTRANTLFNSRVHPGDALTDAINSANPRKTDYVWRDPNNPEWRPSLANPQPGTFRFVLEEDEDYEEGKLAQLEKMELDKTSQSAPNTSDAEAPQPPSTPRMSHAELPKPSSITPSTPTQANGGSNAGALEAANLERRRAEAAKTRPKTSSRLAEVTSARSRSPSPPALDADLADGEGVSPTDSAAKTPSPQFEQAAPTWVWTDETNEFICSSPAYPDFAYNQWGELIASFALRTSSGAWDNKIKGPDNMTEFERQEFYAKKYDDEWAKKAFPFDAPLTYEEAGCGTKYIHDLIRANDARHPEVVAACDRRFAEEWNAHQKAIDDATRQGRKLVATFPDRDGYEMLDAEED